MGAGQLNRIRSPKATCLRYAFHQLRGAGGHENL